MNFNLPRAILVVILVAFAALMCNGLVGIWLNTRSIPGVLFLTSASVGVLALGVVAVRRVS